MLAVIGWQAESVLSFHRQERFAGFESIDAFREWADFYIGYERAYHEGCTLGSLASEIIKTDLDVHGELADAFDQWRSIFRTGLEQMQQRGELGDDADPAQLADLLLAAFQGGMLLAQAAGEIGPLRHALHAAVDQVATFATSGD